jgi:hypothetical protein
MNRDVLPPWSLATRIAFRFVFSYFVLNFVPGYAFGWIPGGKAAAEKYFEFWDAIVLWVGEGGMLHLPYEIDFEARGVGNTSYGWVLCLCYLALAAVATLIWSVLDRNRTRYDRLHQALRFGLRFMVAAAMIRYGIIKAIPSQMTAPPPMSAMDFRIGDLVPNHLLWWTIGASPVFESLIGMAELLGGLLLLVPRTVLLGALFCAANSLTIFALNMCYDVPVKLYSFHLLVWAAVLIAPDLRRLADVFLFNRRAEPARPMPLFPNKWLDRALHVLILLACLRTIGPNLEFASRRYEMTHPARPPLFGYWSVEKIALDGREVPMFTDPDRWRWVSFFSPGMLGVETMVGSEKSYKLDLDLDKKTMKLDQSTFSFDRPEPGLLILDGHLDGQHTRAILRRMPLIREVPAPYKG